MVPRPRPRVRGHAPRVSMPPPRTFRRALVCALVLFTLPHAVSRSARAEQLPLKYYTTADGLPYDTIARLKQDSRGLIWVCTANGLGRFDGSRFVTYRDLGDQHGEAITLNNLGNVHASFGETRRAIEFYEQRLAIARDIGDRRGESITLWNMSLAFDELGERAEAIAHAEASFKIRSELEDPNVGKVREQLAEWRGEL